MLGPNGIAPPSCELCRGLLATDGAMRIAELDLCPTCFEGSNLDATLETDRGFSLQHERREVQTDQGLQTFYKATGTIPTGSGLTASFGREGLGHKVTKLFRREVQVDDPLFDDTIFVDAKVTPELQQLMSDPGFQGAVMDLIAEIQTFRIEDDRVLVHMSSKLSLSPLGTLGRSVAVVMHHLDAFARRTPSF